MMVKTLGPVATYLQARALWLRGVVSLLALVLIDVTSWQFAPPQLLGDTELSLTLSVLAALVVVLPLLVIADTSPISLERDSAAPIRRLAFGVGVLIVTVMVISDVLLIGVGGVDSVVLALRAHLGLLGAGWILTSLLGADRAQIVIVTYCGFVFFSGAGRGHSTWWAFPIASWHYRPAAVAALVLCVVGLLLLLRDPGRVER